MYALPGNDSPIINSRGKQDEYWLAALEVKCNSSTHAIPQFTLHQQHSAAAAIAFLQKALITAHKAEITACKFSDST